MNGGHSYRLSEINEIQKTLEAEIQKRFNLCSKHNKMSEIISGCDTAFVGISLVVSAVGVGLLSTIVAAPVVIGMEAVALTTGILSLISKQFKRKLSLVTEKHEKIRALAETKLSIISDYISKALRDDKISDEEYSSILSEFEKFRKIKDEIRTKHRFLNEAMDFSTNQDKARVSF